MENQNNVMRDSAIEQNERQQSPVRRDAQRNEEWGADMRPIQDDSRWQDGADDQDGDSQEGAIASLTDDKPTSGRNAASLTADSSNSMEELAVCDSCTEPAEEHM